MSRVQVDKGGGGLHCTKGKEAGSFPRLTTVCPFKAVVASMRNDPHGLMCLNSWSPAGGASWGLENL